MRKLVAALLLVLCSLGFTSAAQAADFAPRFDANTHVYLDPDTAKFAPVDLGALADKLKQLGKEQGFEFYLVYQMKNPTARIPAQYGDQYGEWKLDDLINQWSGQSGFNAGKSVVIMVVRSDKNLNAFSIAANAGTDLKAYGIQKQYFKDNLKPIRDKYLPNNPVGFGEAVAKDVNSVVAKSKSAAAFRAALPYYILIIVVLLSLSGYLVFAWIRFKRVRDALKSNLQPMEQSLDSCNAVAIAMQTAYLDFLSDQVGRMKKFVGKTLAAYKEALEVYTDFIIRRELAQKLVDKARKELDQASFWSSIFSVSKLQTALDSITVTEITIKGDEVDLTKLTTVFGGLITVTKYQPSQLLSNIDQLGTSANSQLAAIYNAFGQADANKAKIEKVLQEITDLRPELTAVGLTFDPYSKEHGEIDREAEATLTNIASDPLEALDDSQRISEQVTALKTRIGKAIEIKKSLEETGTIVGAAHSRVTSLRAQAVPFGWPVIKGEATTGKAGETYRLDEKNGNPDALVSSADKHYQTALAAVLSGDNNKATSEKAAAEQSAAEAQALVQTVLDAKDYVEKHVTPVRAALGKLKSEIDPAGTALAALKADFLAENFRSQSGNVKSAQTVADKTAADIEVVRVAYAEQRFLDARRHLTSIGSGIQSVRDGLVAVHHRLEELRRLRQHAKDTAAEAVQFSRTLDGKRKQHAFTTSRGTDSGHEALKPKVTSLPEQVGHAVADWPTLAVSADALMESLRSIDKAIDDESQAHALAQQRVGEVQQAVAGAASACNDNDVREPARHALGTAQSALQSLQSRLTTAKTDWAELARDAESKRGVAGEATRLAAADKEAASEARSAIGRARSYIGECDHDYGRNHTVGSSYGSYGFGTYADLSSARGNLHSAESELSHRRYEDAVRSANHAYDEATHAKQRAEEAVQALITAAILIWQEQERQRLAHEAALRQAELDRQAELARQADANRSTDTGFNAGGYSTGDAGGYTDSNTSTGNSGGTTDSGF